MGSFQRWTLRVASAVYCQDRRFGSIGALGKGLHDGGGPDVRLLHDGTRGTEVNPYIRVGESFRKGSGFFTWAHRLAVRLRVYARCCICFAKAWGCRTNPEGGGTGVDCCGGKLKVGLPGGELHIIFRRVLRVGFLPALVGVTLVVDSGLTPPFGNGEKVIPPWCMGKKWTHGIERLPQGKDVDSVAICAQRLCRLFTTTSNPDLPPHNLCSSSENH